MKQLLLLLFVIFGCSGSPTIDPPLPIPDASPSPIPTPVVPECQPEFIDRDIYHCGACDHRCSAADADRCEDSQCRCGNEPACGDGRDCRGSHCIDSDPDGIVCEFDEQCGAGHACIEGHCTFVECVPEVCDGIDNDCDGLIDNQGSSPIAEFCIGNAPATGELTLPCKPGVRVCDFGIWTECQGDVLPSDEVGIFGCDGIDNNCDGCIDGVDQDGYCESQIPQGFDVLFLIDVSGSMGPKIQMVKQAVTLFSSSLSSNSMFRWGIVTIPGGRGGDPGLYQDLTDFSTFKMSLDGLRVSGSLEMQWAAVAFAADGTLGVSWNPSSTRILILFTDEPGQTGATSPAHDEESMCESLTHGEVLVSVIQTPFEDDFDDCSFRDIPLLSNGAGAGSDCMGDGDCLSPEVCRENICVSSGVVDLANNLSSVIADPCEAP